MQNNILAPDVRSQATEIFALKDYLFSLVKRLELINADKSKKNLFAINEDVITFHETRLKIIRVNKAIRLHENELRAQMKIVCQAISNLPLYKERLWDIRVGGGIDPDAYLEAKRVSKEKEKLAVLINLESEIAGINQLDNAE